MKYKKTIAFGIIAVSLLVAVIVSQPLVLKAVIAKYKSTDHFLTLPGDPRVRYQDAGAKKNAMALLRILPSSEATVETVLGTPFGKPIEIFICSSQATFNEYVFLSKNVRGAVYWEKLFLSPGAFERGSLFELVAHELTHYHFITHLGERAHIENIPLWFREGIAVFVANGGATYTRQSGVFGLMSDKEREAFLSGEVDYWFNSDDPRDAVTPEGIANWLLYRVGALFVHFLQDVQAEQFAELVQQLLSGEQFDRAVLSAYGRNIDSLRSDFADYLKGEAGRRVD